MLENNEDVRKLQDLLRKKCPPLFDSEIEKVAQNLHELGLFLVRSRIKQHSEKPKQLNIENGVSLTDKPP